MSKKKSKIDIATPQEVEKYAESSAPARRDPAVAAPAPEPEDSHDRPEDELPTLRDQVTELQDKFLRAKAELQNVARRAQQEKADAVRYGNAELLKSLLAVVDDFERTLEAAAHTDKVEAVVEGVRLVYDKLLKLLKDNAVEAIESVGTPFDPTEHAAMMQQPSDEHEPGVVIREVQRGYRYRDRVLRPTQVVVAQKSTES